LTAVRRSKLVFNASELSGVPSKNFTFGRNVNVYVNPSGDFCQLVASRPSIWFDGGFCL
jgi:hypothetical protein